ncbi:hypothetical protein G9444_1419 [Rhodococcus erythropolis]|uniref:Uncharacterized protein n=1 Tax=Rhodococcus erythropolis TaxID=1833 RepID=A0A6G9CNP8_RHOER|nr:hypothetical protein RHOER0001_3928 [Rhodococcus erythropolis SK121]EQM31381.1 hypothetical protein N601_22610 [Rhodococcus erythropolis DN1]ERB54496.1 hypothetical protein N806_25565 [Rhodococcus sp. P27]QIP38663.1 hypothetical protein G9444_1419 [Rhodococcus erythropolis]
MKTSTVRALLPVPFPGFERNRFEPDRSNEPFRAIRQEFR